MSIRVQREPEGYFIWSEPNPGDFHVGRCVGAGATFEEAKQDAREELLRDLKEVEQLQPEAR